MEQLGLGTLGELAKSGLGYSLFILALIALWWRDRELWECRKQSEANNIKMAVALENAYKAMSEMADVARQRLETEKMSSHVMQALIQTLNIEGERNKERADAIVQQIKESRRPQG